MKMTKFKGFFQCQAVKVAARCKTVSETVSQAARKSWLWVVGGGTAAAVITQDNMAHAQLALPADGVDVAGYIALAIPALGVVVAAAVGGYFAFLIVRAALRWARKFAG